MIALQILFGKQKTDTIVTILLHDNDHLSSLYYIMKQVFNYADWTELETLALLLLKTRLSSE